MIIRSQDKKALTNFTQVTDLGVVVKEKECEINVYYPFSINEDYSRMCLGTYSTEEKAIKVLDMIQKRYEEFCCNNYCSVFEMPQDSEV